MCCRAVLHTKARRQSRFTSGSAPPADCCLSCHLHRCLGGRAARPGPKQWHSDGGCATALRGIKRGMICREKLILPLCVLEQAIHWCHRVDERSIELA